MNARFRWELLLGAVVLVGAGVVVGRIWPHQHVATEDAAPLEDDHDHAHLEPETLANLGVTVAAVRRESYQRTVSVAARVVPTPRTEQAANAPWGGRVLSVEVSLGQVVAPGEVLARMVRDPLPRPELVLTADVLRPAPESLHGTVMDLRRSVDELEITRSELARLEEFGGSAESGGVPVVPLQRLIDLRYQRTRLERSVDQARHELSKHGLTDDQIASVESGGTIPAFDDQRWRRALEHNGLWTEGASRLYGAIPEGVRDRPWVTATIGELSASGLASSALTTWLAGDPSAGVHFLAVAVLLQRGHALADVQQLHAAGVFGEIIEVVAPATDGSWDVHSLAVTPGTRIAPGDEIARLRNPEQLYLRAEPVGSEVAAVLAAAGSGRAATASPLVEGSGPNLTGLVVEFLRGEDDHRESVAFLPVANAPIEQKRNPLRPPARTWQLRVGMRYLVDLPVEAIDEVFVLPPTAVVRRGPDEVVLIEDDDHFEPLPVVVRYRGRDALAVQIDHVPDGVRVVQTGALELALALSRTSDTGHAHQH